MTPVNSFEVTPEIGLVLGGRVLMVQSYIVVSKVDEVDAMNQVLESQDESYWFRNASAYIRWFIAKSKASLKFICRFKKRQPLSTTPVVESMRLLHLANKDAIATTKGFRIKAI